MVQNVSITLRRGEAVGLLGPNGAGKTTTFYMIVGLVKPDTGAISLDGADITRLPMYRRARLGIGYPPGAMKLVTAAVGAPAAKDLFYTARRIGAEEAQRLGVVQRVVSDASLEETIQQQQC